MAKVCDRLKTCKFFEKYKDILDHTCKGLIADYCKGQYMEQCKRKKYIKEKGVLPPDDMLPV